MGLTLLKIFINNLHTESRSLLMKCTDDIGLVGIFNIKEDQDIIQKNMDDLEDRSDRNG